MNRYFLWILTILPLPALAQQRTAPKPVPTADTIYFDQDWAHTDIAEDRKFARLIRHGSDGLPAGTVRDFYYPSWKKQWEGKLVSEDPELSSGVCTFWYENGRMKAQGTYARGQALSDYKEWHLDGTPMKCKSAFVESLPTEEAQLHSQLHIGGSQHVFYAVLPAHTTSIIYRLDIRDEGQPPISWNSAIALSAAAVTGGLGLVEIGTAALQMQANQQKPPTLSTKCHYFVTTDRAQAEAFLKSQGVMPDSKECLFAVRNTQREVRPIIIPGGAQQVYICVNNDNTQTAAIAKVSVTAIVKECK